MGMLIPVQEFEGTIRPLTRRDLRWWKRSTYHRIAQINACLGELSSRSKPVTRRQLIRLLKAGFTVIFIAECANGFVAGTSTFVESPQMLQGKGWLEDVVVLTQFRDLGLGTLLTLAVVGEAHRRGIKKLDLTSSDERTTAHTVYYKLGWGKRDDSTLMRRRPHPDDRLLDPENFGKLRLTR
jgi:GNAT superfamily N-acetyltransferase